MSDGHTVTPILLLLVSCTWHKIPFHDFKRRLGASQSTPACTSPKRSTVSDIQSVSAEWPLGQSPRLSINSCNIGMILISACHKRQILRTRLLPLLSPLLIVAYIRQFPPPCKKPMKMPSVIYAQLNPTMQSYTTITASL